MQIAFALCVMNAGGSCEEAAELATDALQTVRRTGDAELTAAVQAAVAYPCLHAGRVREVLDAADAALELTADRPELSAGFMFESPRGFAFLWRFLALAMLGRSGEALVAMDEVYAFLRERRHKETLSWAAYFRLLTLRAAGAEKMDETEVPIAREAHEIAEAIAGPWVKLLAQISLGAAYLGAGRLAEALEITSRAVTLMETSHGGLEALVRPEHSLALTGTGDPLAGMAEAARAIRRCVECGNRQLRPLSCAAFATATAAAATGLGRASEILDDGERMVAETGARGFLPELLYGRALLQAAAGDQDARRDTLRRGVTVAGQNGAHGWEKRFGDTLAGRTKPASGRHK